MHQRALKEKLTFQIPSRGGQRRLLWGSGAETEILGMDRKRKQHVYNPCRTWKPKEGLSKAKGTHAYWPLEKIQAPTLRVPLLSCKARHMQGLDGPLHGSLGKLGLGICILRKREKNYKESQNRIVIKSINFGASLHGFNISFGIY